MTLRHCQFVEAIAMEKHMRERWDRRKVFNKAVQEFLLILSIHSFIRSHFIFLSSLRPLDSSSIVVLLLFSRLETTRMYKQPIWRLSKQTARSKKKYMWAIFQKNLFKSSRASSINGSSDDCDEDYSSHNAIKSESKIAEKLVNNFHLAINLSSEKSVVGKIFSASVYHALVIKINLSSHRGYDSLFSFREFHANEIFPLKSDGSGWSIHIEPITQPRQAARKRIYI